MKLVVGGAMLGVAVLTRIVHAGGMELPIWGVHSMERAGALDASATDADALWLNPAGLASFVGKGTQGLAFDIAYLYQPVTFTPPGGIGQATNQQPGEPLPSLAGAVGLDDHFVVGGGVSWRYIPISRYDGVIQGYMTSGLAGSRFVQLTAGGAYLVSPKLRIGATVQDLVSALDLGVVASACTGAGACPASAESNSAMPLQLDETSWFAPSGSVGVQYDVTDYLTIGGMVQAPTRVSATGTLTVTPPTATMTVTGNQAVGSFWLPPELRAGVAYRDRVFTVEAAVDVELWSLQDKLGIDPRGVSVDQIQMSDMAIARDYKTSVDLSLGGEAHFANMQLGAGIAYETGAAPTANVSLLTVDGPKYIFGLGGGYAIDDWDIGASVGFVYQPTIDVTDGQVGLLAPLHQPIAMPAIVNDGSYRAFDIMAGLRFAHRFKLLGS